ncbi:MAG: NAD(P)/FAD-dependent oxidoreductase, partial [Microcystis sp.]
MGFNRTPLIDSFHINRAKFEQDVLQMTQEMGATFYNGRVIDVELTPCDQLHTVTVKLDQASIELKTKHVIDAAGRRFIIGKKLNNVILDSEEMTGINTGSAWLRVKNIDLNIFDN